MIDLHAGCKFIIVGCGMSALSLRGTNLRGIKTIGVNDAGGVIDLDYLLIVDYVSQFTPERTKVISETKCGMFISVNSDWDDTFKNVEKSKITLGNLTLDHIDKHMYPDRIDYSNTSTYMAVITAYKMGATKIGIIGLDFTPNHYNSNDGVHKLVSKYNQLDPIRNSYKLLCEKLQQLGVEVYNLSKESLVDTIPKISLDQFIDL